MHFSSRIHAGRLLARQIEPLYRYEDCVVLALNRGGVVVGAQIAQKIHCAILMLPIKEIFLPREPVSIGSIAFNGNFVINSDVSLTDSREMIDEFRGVIEEEKITKLREMTSDVGRTELTNKSMIEHRNVILVSDSINGTTLLDMAYEYLKPIKISSLIVATPISDVKAVDWIHVMADKIFCLWVSDDYDSDLNRYFDQNKIPSQKRINTIIQNVILNWK